MKIRLSIALLSAAALVVILPACGGGGSSGGGGGPSPVAIALVSSDAAGVEGNSDSDQPSISALAANLGRYVAFRSFATNLTADTDTGVDADVFRKDLTTGTVVKLSLPNAGGEANGDSEDPSISGDGSKIIFSSTADNLQTGIAVTAARKHIYLYDFGQALGSRITLISRSAANTAEGDADSDNPAISQDGTFVAFQSFSQNLITGFSYTASTTNVYRQTIPTAVNSTVISSISTTALTAGDGNSTTPDISANGRYVVFDSLATTLVASDTNTQRDIFLRDHTAASTTRINVTSAGVQVTGGASDKPVISEDGLIVAFRSQATDIDPADATKNDIFTRVWSGTPSTDHVSVHPNGVGTGSGEGCDDPNISGDGRYIVWHSPSTSLTSGDSNGVVRDVFRNDGTTGSNIFVSTSADWTQGNATSGTSGSRPAVTPDGLWVAFDSISTNLVSPATTAARKHVYRKGSY